MEHVKVCRLDELEERVPYVKRFDNLELGVILHNQSVYAFENFCPHMGGPVCLGDVKGAVKAKLDKNMAVEKEYVSDDDIR